MAVGFETYGHARRMAQLITLYSFKLKKLNLGPSQQDPN